MKRAEQLQKLSREHHGSLVMAKRMAEIAKTGEEAELEKAMEDVKVYYKDELEFHFQHEEQTVFTPIFKEHKELIDVTLPLLKEHGVLRRLILQMTMETARDDLAVFAKMLKDHTRVEERELFPQVEAIFSEEQMDAVLGFIPIELR